MYKPYPLPFNRQISIKKILVIFTLSSILFLPGRAQIVYEKAYFIDQTQERTECIIRNVGWKDNPVEFEYKLHEEGANVKAGIDSIMEFGISGTDVYRRYRVLIDRSGTSSKTLSSERNPVYQEEVLFLKVLVEGSPSLLYYSDGNLERFFYTDENGSAEQLVYKKYQYSDDKVGENRAYRQQLYTAVNSCGKAPDDISRVAYSKKSLAKYFTEDHHCSGSSYIDYVEDLTDQALFYFTFKLGVNRSTLSINNVVPSYRDTDFGEDLTFRAGIESEFVLPFLKKKLSLILEPVFQSYSALSTFIIRAGFPERNVDVNYQSLEIQVGTRYYMYLNERSKFSLTAYALLDKPVNSSIVFEDGPELIISQSSNLALSGGYVFKDKLLIEFRYGFDREILGPYTYWSSYYPSMSLNIGYRIH